MTFAEPKCGDTEERTVTITADTKFHCFSKEELTEIQTKLLKWYEANKRNLPWRQQVLVTSVAILF